MAAKQRQKLTAMETETAAAAETATMDLIGEDLLHNILSRLPAESCASAACVNRSWNLIINRLLTLPNLSSALSCHPCLQGAVDEAVDKVLARPIRPQFVIASIGPSFDLEEAQCLISDRFSSEIPIITSISYGVFGQDANTNEFEEVQWDTWEDNKAHENFRDEDEGVLVTVGFLPGLTVDLIPLKKTRGLMTENFVRSIRERSFSRSGSSPMGILLFSDEDIDIKPVLAKLDYAFSSETAIVGDAGSKFLYQDGKAISPSNSRVSSSAAVALLFSRDTGKPPGVGETQFHVMLSTGVSPIGPKYKAVYVKAVSHDNSTRLMATTDEIDFNMDGETILDPIYDELGDHTHSRTLYVGVTKMRKCTSRHVDTNWIFMREFQMVLRGDYEYLYVHGDGIKSYDSFQFYHANSDLARASCNNVSNKMKLLKQDLNHVTDDHSNSNGSMGMQKKSVFGGMMFACYGRGKLYFGEPNVDASPFLENFPGVTFSGTYCNGEIAHGNFSLYENGSKEHGSTRCSLHEFSTVYLVMSYTPPALPQL
ncbi:F-box/LRR-repeat protein At5g63520-like [Solanum stenotomum]|uniref:F-box/LRR-repeat protein At5g63520-like n=1 Tax=Solanum stenotomum TaxID=172797 RepID=UPI0020D1BB74|nr:F-box/LRR-repeat protein At5g63520-like [Solanum stenotomum]